MVFTTLELREMNMMIHTLLYDLEIMYIENISHAETIKKRNDIYIYINDVILKSNFYIFKLAGGTL